MKTIIQEEIQDFKETEIILKHNKVDFSCRYETPAGKRVKGDPTGALRRGGSRDHEKFEAARSAPTSIRQGRIEGAFCPQGDHGLCLEELAAETRHARGKRRLSLQSTAMYKSQS